MDEVPIVQQPTEGLNEDALQLIKLHEDAN